MENQSDVEPQELMNFYEALKHMVDGKKITRVSWESEEEYGFMKDGIVMIHTRGKTHNWIISEADALGEDWVVIN